MANSVLSAKHFQDEEAAYAYVEACAHFSYDHNWSWSDQWNAKASIAAPLGSTPTLVGTNYSARMWLALSKGF